MPEKTTGRKDLFFKNALIFASILIFALLTVFFLLPFLCALLQAFFPSATSTGKTVGLRYELLLKSALYTFLEAIFSVFIALAEGLPAAFLLSKRAFFFKRLLYAFAAVPLCVPAFITALGYISTFGRSGLVTRAFLALFPALTPPLFLYSFWGIVLCQGFYNFPLVMLTVGIAWQALDTREAESARLLGANEAHVFFSITLPDLLPAICSACIPIFLYSFFSFVIVQLFSPPGTSTLEVLVYHAARSTMQFKLVGFAALVETAFFF